VIACASTPEDGPRKAKITDDQLTAFLLDVGDELGGRLVIDRVEPRANEAILTIRDRDSGVTQRMSISRDLDLADVRRKILNASTSMLLASGGGGRQEHPRLAEA
jgi:hypothetical protein